MWYFADKSASNDKVFLDVKLKQDMDVAAIKERVLEWMVRFDHKRIYTLFLKGTDLMLAGFNHHNKISKTNPYPVFAKFDPIMYYDLTQAENTMERFKHYDLKIN